MSKIPNFSNLMGEWVRKESRKKKQLLVFHPYTLGTKCLRKLYYHQVIEKELGDRTIMIFEAGHTIHSWVNSFLKWCSDNKKSAIELVETESPFSLVFHEKGLEIDIHGRVDNVVKIYGEPYIWETKSIKSFFRRLKVPEKMPDGNTKNYEEYPLPLPEHIIQIHPYMRSRKYKKAIMFYVDKTTFRVKWFIVDYDKKVMEDIEKKVIKVVEHILVKKLPPRIDKDMKYWECRYCLYYDECFMNRVEVDEKI